MKATTSETIVIGGVINRPDFLLELSDLKAEFFTDRLNKIIFIAIKRLYKNGAKQIDIADIYALIESNQKYLKLLEKNGGIDYLEELQILGEEKGIEEIQVHSQNIIDCAYKNEMSKLFENLTKYVSSADDSSRNEINKSVEEQILEVKAKYSSKHKVEMVSAKTDKIFEMIEDEDEDTQGFETSVPLLSRFVTYRKGELIIYSAKAKVGKSQLVVNEAYNLAIRQGIPIMILDTELQTKTFVIRMIARITGYSFKFVESAQWKKYPKCVEKIKAAKREIDEAPLSHTYIVGWSNDEIKNEIKRMKIQHDIQIVFYDYIKVEEVTKSMQEHQVLGNITNWLKNSIAGDLDIAVVALAQMSDYVTEERGFKIANSEKIKNYASSVVYLIEKTQEQIGNEFGEELSGNSYFFVDYNRNGAQMHGDMQDHGINILFHKNKAYLEQSPNQNDDIIDLLDDDEEFEITEDGDVVC